MEQTVRLTNGEERSIRIDDVRLGGSDADQFLFEERCTGQQLVSGETCPVRVRFHPTEGGPRSATLVILTAAGDESSVDLEGTGTVTASLRAPRRVEEGSEGDERTASFTVTLSAPSTDEVNVEFETEEGTAAADEDYEEQSGTLTFEPGSTELTVSVPIVADLLDEADEEVFSLRLTEVDGAEVAGPGREVIIEDDDRAPSISIASQSVEEGDEGSVEITFLAVLSGESGRLVRADVGTIDGTARAGDDYRAVDQTLMWEPGETEASFTVAVLGDPIDEEDERFIIGLSGLDGARRPDPETGTEEETAGTIIDNDPPPSLFISDPRVNEGNPPASVVAPFDIMLSSPSGRPVTVLATTAQSSGLSCMGGPGPAIRDEDYIHRVAEVTIPVGEDRAGFSVPVISDTGTECFETQFLVLLSQAVNATIEDAQGVGTILDDDPVE
jgi:Calx-beta domain